MIADKSISRDRIGVDVSLLALRLIVGIIFAAHGSQKVLGLFGGPGLAEMMKMMGPPLGFLVSIGEFLGGLGLIVGFLSRFSAASLIVIMLGAIGMVHGKNGFFMGTGPESTLATAGFEYNLALIGLLLPIFIAGPGQFSLGRFLPLPKARGSDRPVVFLE